MVINPGLICTCLAEICSRCRVECFMPLGSGMDRSDTLLPIGDDFQIMLRQWIECITRVCNMAVSEHRKSSLLDYSCDC